MYKILNFAMCLRKYYKTFWTCFSVVTEKAWKINAFFLLTFKRWVLLTGKAWHQTYKYTRLIVLTKFLSLKEFVKDTPTSKRFGSEIFLFLILRIFPELDNIQTIFTRYLYSVQIREKREQKCIFSFYSLHMQILRTAVIKRNCLRSWKEVLFRTIICGSR